MYRNELSTRVVIKRGLFTSDIKLGKHSKLSTVSFDKIMFFKVSYSAHYSWFYNYNVVDVETCTYQDLIIIVSIH